MEPTAGSGSGAAEPVEDDRIQEPASNPNASSTTAAAPLPPFHLEQPGGGGDGSTSATAVDPRKVKQAAPPLPPRGIPSHPSPAGRSSSSTHSLDNAGGGAGASSSTAAWVERKVKLASLPFPAPFTPSSAGSIASGAGGSSSSAGRMMMGSFDYELEFKQILRLQQSVIIEEGEEEEQQVESSRAKDVLPRKEKKLRQVKVRPRPEKRKSPWSWLKNKIFRREGRQICSEHVQHQTQPISEAFKKLLEKVKRWKNTESTSSCRKEELLKFFSTYDKTQDIFAFLRLLVAIEMCSHRLVYEPLIPDVARGVYSLKVWCFLHVTPARVESEYLMMRALASALDVSLIVETFQGDYARDIYTSPVVPRLAVTLLYNGCHYDIIYPRAPSSESSSHQAS